MAAHTQGSYKRVPGIGQRAYLLFPHPPLPLGGFLDRKKAVKEFFFSRGAELSDDMFVNGVELGTWLPSWLDGLTGLLLGTPVYSESKRDAMKKLIPAFEKFMKKKFPSTEKLEPKLGSYIEVNSPTNKSGETKMQTHTESKKAPKKVATGVAKKAAPAAKAKAKPEKEKGTRAKFSESAKITVLVAQNPKREGSSSHERFALYSKNKTVGAFLAAGGTRADIAWDVAAEYIKVSE